MSAATRSAGDARGGSSGAHGQAPLEDFRRTFDDHYDYVWRSLRRLGVAERDLEDVTHEVFVEAYRKRERYDPARPVRPWLFAFAIRFASDYRKLARHRTELRGSAPEATSDAPTAEDAVARADSARLLSAALGDLSLELRAVIVLYELEDTAMKDIAESLDIPLATAYSRLRLARAQCAAAVRRLMEETP